MDEGSIQSVSGRRRIEAFQEWLCLEMHEDLAGGLDRGVDLRLRRIKERGHLDRREGLVDQ